MKQEKTALSEINAISDKIPTPVLEDVNKRVTDWLSAGGNEDDPYIEQQLRFAKKFL